jgi:membrane-associated protein
VAGIGGMSYRRFASFNVIGATAWVASMTLIGFILGSRFPLLVQHIEKVIVVVVVLSLLPGLYEWLAARRRAAAVRRS